MSPADLAGLDPHVLAAIGSDFLAFCNAAERPFGRRSAKARAARSSLYAGAGVAVIASIVIKLLAIDRVLTWFPDWFPNLLLVISGLFTLGLVIKLDILDRTERIYRVEASEVTLKLLARRSTLAVSKEGYGFDLEDHDGFASVLGGPFPAATLMTHVRWRLGSFDFETVYSREEAMLPPIRASAAICSASIAEATRRHRSSSCRQTSLFPGSWNPRPARTSPRSPSHTRSTSAIPNSRGTSAAIPPTPRAPRPPCIA